MAPSQRFANYTGAKEAPEEAFEYDKSADQNPVLRGLPLAIVSNVFVFRFLGRCYQKGMSSQYHLKYSISHSALVQQWFWNNAKLGSPKFIPGLGDAPRRFLVRLSILAYILRLATTELTCLFI